MAPLRSPRDPVLVAALATAFALCLYGIGTMVLHPDQMALRPLFLADRAPLNPGWFEKPPGYSYLNLVLAVGPIAALRAVGLVSPATAAHAEIVWSRVVAALLLLGTVALTFAVARRAFGVAAARVVAVVLATSAGMIAFVHQLTADVPVTFWMVVAFHFAVALCREDRPADYVGAGLATGIATATKYNGLGVGIALVAAHAFRELAMAPSRSWRRLVLHPGLWLGLAMVAVGFVLANPYALLDHATFLADFRYNAMVAPRYEGQTGRSYGAFFLRLVELAGAPACVGVGIAIVGSLGVAARCRRADAATGTLFTTLAVCLLYYATFARFPRLETRFVLPILPFVLLLAGPALARCADRRPRALAALVALVVAYNVVCAAWVGRRFLDDPRLAATAWLRANVPPGSRVESDMYSPGDEIAAPGVTVATMPFVNGRERLFQTVFAGDAFVNGSPEVQEAAERSIAWYESAALEARKPDVVVVNSLYYDRFVEPGLRRDLYPSMADFFTTLLAGTDAYTVAFDRRSPAVPSWVYPRDVDFLDNRATILQRRK